MASVVVILFGGEVLEVVSDDPDVSVLVHDQDVEEFFDVDVDIDPDRVAATWEEYEGN